MFGKILVITKNNAIVKLTMPSNVMNDLINVHVVFEDSNKKILGEIEEINGDTLNIKFIGEITDSSFISGVIRKPTLDANIRIINDKELYVLVGNQEKSINIGVSPLYNNYPLKIKIDDLFSGHTAIFGNTGSGKTNGICRILQNVFSNSNIIPYKASFFIFDSFGEYINAFKDLNKINPNFNFKVISTSIKKNNYEKLCIPVYLLELEDILNLLDANSFSQIAMIENALTLVKVFVRNDEKAQKYKNYILSKAIISLMYTNQTSTRIRDEIFEILTESSTNEINLDAIVSGVGYTRSFKDCFIIDSEGMFVERNLIAEYLRSFIKEDISVDTKDYKIYYNLKDLEKALNFTLYTERYLLNDKMFNDAISLKVKLHDLANRNYSRFFENCNYLTLEEYINSLQMINGKKAQIVNINLEDIDDRFAKTLTKIFGRLFCKYTRNLESRASKPIHFVLEEAHRYVTADDDKILFGYNIFERIAKEGRKYGLILDLITQRPTDINENVISQCSNFLIFKINHPIDLEYITKIIPNMCQDIVEKQKNLQPGTCVAFGKIFKIPMIIKMEKATPPPESADCRVYDNWMVMLNQNASTENKGENI